MRGEIGGSAGIYAPPACPCGVSDPPGDITLWILAGLPCPPGTAPLLSLFNDERGQSADWPVRGDHTRNHTIVDLEKSGSQSATHVAVMVVLKLPMRIVLVAAVHRRQRALAAGADRSADELGRDGFGIQPDVIGRYIPNDVLVHVARNHDRVDETPRGQKIQHSLTVERISVPLLPSKRPDGWIRVAIAWSEAKLIGKNVPACARPSQTVHKPVGLFFALNGSGWLQGGRAVSIDPCRDVAVCGSSRRAILTRVQDMDLSQIAETHSPEKLQVWSVQAVALAARACVRNTPGTQRRGARQRLPGHSRSRG